jgi:hypothetical protein
MFITEYFERVQRNAYYKRREPKWAILALGIFMLALGAVVSVVRHGLYNGRFEFALGLAAVFCAVTEYALRDSPWRWATRGMAFGMWATSMWIALHW